MTLYRSIFRGGATLTFGQVVSQACSLIRGIIVARVVSPKDFGIAATFAVTISIFDMMSNLSADVLLIQDKEGNAPDFQKTAHVLQASRGVINALLIYLLGGPISYLFDEPQARWAFEFLAVVPLLRGFVHLDTCRLQRDMHFRPIVAMNAIPQLLATSAALPLAFWLKDYTLMLWLLVLQNATATLISHIVAERAYGWGWKQSFARRIVSFGWPLMINGFLMFIILDGDRFIIGSARSLFPRNSLTLADLGMYSVAFAFTMGPTLLFTNVSGPVFLPLLSRAKERLEVFERRYAACVQFLALVATGMTGLFVLLGGWAVVVIYGTKYAGASGLVAWLGVMWGLRLLRVAPTAAALSLGDSKNSMYSNITRTAALVGVLATAATGAALMWIAVSGVVGEVFALLVCVARLRAGHGVRASYFVNPFAVFAVSMIAAGIAAWLTPGFGVAVSAGIAACLIIVTWIATLAAFPRFRADLADLVVKVGVRVRPADAG